MPQKRTKGYNEGGLPTILRQTCFVFYDVSYYYSFSMYIPLDIYPITDANTVEDWPVLLRTQLFQ